MSRNNLGGSGLGGEVSGAVEGFSGIVGDDSTGSWFVLTIGGALVKPSLTADSSCITPLPEVEMITGSSPCSGIFS
jgi:hypothetical protein